MECEKEAAFHKKRNSVVVERDTAVLSCKSLECIRYGEETMPAVGEVASNILCTRVCPFISGSNARTRNTPAGRL